MVPEAQDRGIDDDCDGPVWWRVALTVKRGEAFIIDDESPLACRMDLVVDDDPAEADRFFARSFVADDDLASEWSTDRPTAEDCGPADLVRGAYRIREDESRCLVEVLVRVLLVPRPGFIGDPDLLNTDENIASKVTEWRDAIRSAWSRKHKIKQIGGGCRCAEYDVDVDVRFTIGPWTDWDEPDPPRAGFEQVVDVLGGGIGEVYDIFNLSPERPDASTFYIAMSGDQAAHEFGHWVGNADEYPAYVPSDLRDIAILAGVEDCPGRIVTSNKSIMFAGARGEVHLYHYRHFARWLAARKCCTFEEGSAGDIPESETTVAVDVAVVYAVGTVSPAAAVVIALLL